MEQGEDYRTNNYRSFNRGNKLKQTAREPYGVNPERQSIQANAAIDEQFVFDSISAKTRAILPKNRKKRNERTVLDPDNPYYGINLEDFWGVPETPEEIKHMPGFVHVLKMGTLRKLSNQMLDTIVDENKVVQSLQRLSDILMMGDAFEKPTNWEELMDPEELADLRTSLHETLAHCSEYVRQLTKIRGKVTDAHVQKRKLASDLLNEEDDNSQSHKQQKH